MSPLVIYGLITVVGALVLFMMTIFGAHGDVGADVGGHIGFGMDGDMHAGGMEMGEVGGPSVLSLRLILFFLIGFGLLGYVSYYLQWGLHHIFWAVIGGLVCWYIGYSVLKLLYRQQSNSQVRATTFVGRTARVTAIIPKAGVGEISADDGETGQSIYLNARAADPEKQYDKGQVVTIKSVTGGTATVQ